MKTKAFFLLMGIVSNVALASHLSFAELSQTCATGVHPDTLQALVRVESQFNPFAIGVVNAQVKQPSTFEEAVKTAKALYDQGHNFSMGLGQINIKNFKHYGLSFETVFDPCTNLSVASDLLKNCFVRSKESDAQYALQKALSCYYSGNFKTGFKEDIKGLPSYVERVKTAVLQNKQAVDIQIPALDSRVQVSSQQFNTNNAVAVQKKKVPSDQSNNPSPESTQHASWDAFKEWR